MGKRKISGHQKPNKKIKSQEHLVHAMPQPSYYLPELIVHQILSALPTIPAVTLSLVCKQWQSILSSLPDVGIIDFDEGGDDQHVQHRKFINSLRRYLRHCLREEDDKPVNKLRLHIKYSSRWDSPVVDKCLKFAIQRSVKEIDISLRSSEHEVIGSTEVRLWTLLKAEFITTLNLTNVSLYMGLEDDLPELVFPFLKTMSLTRVDFESPIMSTVIESCPKMESLSLASCCLRCQRWTDEKRDLSIISSTLKYLEVKKCKCEHRNQNLLLTGLLMVDATNLESFTFNSGYDDQHFRDLVLLRCWNLKYFRVDSKCLREVVLMGGCAETVLKGTLNAPHLLFSDFSGFLSSLSEFCLEAPNLLESTLSWSSEYFSNLRDFRNNFGCSKKITLYVGDVQTLIFPEKFRKTFGSSPLLNHVKKIKVYRTSMATDFDLTNTLRWMAPSARIVLKMQ